MRKLQSIALILKLFVNEDQYYDNFQFAKLSSF